MKTKVNIMSRVEKLAFVSGLLAFWRVSRSHADCSYGADFSCYTVRTTSTVRISKLRPLAKVKMTYVSYRHEKVCYPHGSQLASRFRE